MRVFVWVLAALAAPPIAIGEGPDPEFLVRVSHLQALKIYEWSAITYSGNGSSEDPVVIEGARSKAVRTEAEWEWVRSRWPDHKVISQRVVRQEDRMIDVLEIQPSGSEATNVYFDVTDSCALQKSQGEWEFVDANGDVLKGSVEVGDYDGPHPSKAWGEAVGRRTGFLTYQIEDVLGDGVITAGPIVDGRADGEWETFRRSFGLATSSFVAGRQEGKERLWNASGVLRAEFLFEGDSLKQIWDWESGSPTEVDMEQLRNLAK